MTGTAGTAEQRDRSSLAGLFAVLLTSTALLPLFQDQGWVLRVAGAAIAVAAAGVATRRLRLPRAVQPLLGLLALLLYVTVVFVGDTLAVLLPTGDTLGALQALLDGGFADIRELTPPVPTSPGLVLLTALGVGAAAVMVELAVGVLGRAVLAGLPLLTLYAVPATVLEDGVGVWPFVLGTAGWLLLLTVETEERVGRWGVLVRGPGRTGLRGAGTAGGIGLVAAGAALVVPALLPALGDGVIDTGGGGTRTVTTYNPITTLRGDLTLPEPRDVLTYTTDDPSPDYLRLTTLGLYDGSGWRQDELKGNQRDAVDQAIPTPPGLAGTQPTRTVSSTLSVLSLKARWLPVPAVPTDIEIDGPWLWDAESQTVYSTQTETDVAPPYDVTSRRVLPEPEALQSRDRGLPAEVAPYAGALEATSEVRRITAEAVGDASTDYARALALQSYFQDPSFTYSLQPETGSNPDALQDFLETKVGFCQQYSTAMAVMLRLSGIPSRVAVGFTAGNQQADGSWLVTTREAHAWPEAWIAGAGWTRFEPTPASAGNGVATPSYANETGEENTPGATPTPAAPGAPTPSAAPSAPSDRPDRALDDIPLTAAGGNGSSGPPFRLLLGLAGVLVLVALPQLTQQAHRALRWRRAARAGTAPRHRRSASLGAAVSPASSGGAAGSDAAEAAWAQVGDDARDAGHPLDPALSPRQAAERLRRHGALPAAATPGLAAVVRSVEQTRYARAADPDSTELRQAARTVRRGLRADQSRGRRLRVLLLPPSWLHRGRLAAGEAVGRGRVTRQVWGRAVRTRVAASRS